jgi:hypothetical protein
MTLPLQASEPSPVDPCAELTLRLIRTGQEALGPMTSRVGWTFYPELKSASWAEARDILAAVPKPAIVAAIVEPGMLALWSMDALGERGRDALAYQIRNQCAYYDEKLTAVGVDATGEIETPDGDFRLSVAAFRQWAQDYCIAGIGIGMEPGPTPQTGRLLVRPPGGSRPFIGSIESTATHCEHAR